MNPDCKAGKHVACSGTAWDDDRDELTSCACPCHITPTGRTPTPPTPDGVRKVTGL